MPCSAKTRCAPPARRHNVIEFIAAGRATPGLADALSQAEEQVKTLTGRRVSMEAAKGHAFTPPSRAWIADRITRLNDLLAKPTGSAVACWFAAA